MNAIIAFFLSFGTTLFVVGVAMKIVLWRFNKMGVDSGQDPRSLLLLRRVIEGVCLITFAFSFGVSLPILDLHNLKETEIFPEVVATLLWSLPVPFLAIFLAATNNKFFKFFLRKGEQFFKLLR